MSEVLEMKELKKSKKLNDLPAKPENQKAVSLNEVLVLNGELVNLNKEEGISFHVKYDLVKFLEKTNDVVTRFNKSKLDLFKKLGTCTDEKKQTYTLEGTENEEKAMEELQMLINKKETFDFEFQLEDFSDLKSSNSYIQIMRFIKK